MAASTDHYSQHPLPPPPPLHQAQQYQQPYSQYQQYQQYPQQQDSRQDPRQDQRDTNYPPPAAQGRSTSSGQVPRSRTFSFNSQKSQRSHKSSGSRELHETPAEKEAKRLHSKADPTLAMSEAEPSAVAAMMTESAYTPLRSLQHKDTYGKPINEPDRSNPTRYRWERPLDTIRSFEDAIDGSYFRKSMYGQDPSAQYSRRNSFVGGPPPQRNPRESYHSNRPMSYRPEQGYYDGGPPRNSYFDGQAYGGGYGTGPSRQRMSRMQSEPQYPVYNRNQNGYQQNVYPLPHKDRSYETVTSAAASGNSDAAGYQTDPTSSDNSSIDRSVPAKRFEPVNENGNGPRQQAPQRKPLGPMSNGNGQPPRFSPPQSQPQQQPQAPPPVAQNNPAPVQKRGTLLRRTSTQQKSEAPADKRKSWFSRRFSKNP